MKKIYIAGKIGGLPFTEYMMNFDNAKTECVKLGFLPVSPTDLPHQHDRTWSSYMKEDLVEMMKCEAVYVLKNWRTSPGAQIEVNLALSLGTNIIFQK